MSNELTRCDWAAHDILNQEYHDNEWGKPVHDERTLFKMLILEGMQAGVAAVILSVSCDLWANVRKEKSLLYYGIFAAAFIGNFVFGVSVIFLILAAASVGLLRLFFDRRKEAGR